ncbi:MAG: malto-oligosyltrehalose trehalohydrolase [Candidatus Competibacteraceae bacterium]
MPFGAQLLEEGGVRFRLWAPTAQHVELCLETGGDRDAVLPMPAVGDGWFELVTDQAKAGDLYRYRIDGKLQVPDPASRYNPKDVHGPSQIVDPSRFAWKNLDWLGRPWEEVVLYELHVGTFTPKGTFKAAKERLDYLVDLGVTAIELMPIADFPGKRNWGYDGVLPYAPDAGYGSPDDLKDLIQAAHERGLMVFLDVVYNHFGPEGNYLSAYARDFFTDRHKTPWGDAINFDGPNNRVVRDFFIHNALYWLEEFNFDGLRLDAVHAIVDDSQPHILEELAEAVRQGPGRERHCHLVLENGLNIARYLSRDNLGGPRYYNAQWNDDIHHAMHILLTGEKDGYYMDYADKPVWYLGRCLSEGFAYQGEPSPFEKGRERGEPSAHLPTTAFVSFLQNHDQIGNRAFGERISAIAAPRPLEIMTAILLLAPSPPLLFMGQEFAAEQPFLFFCDFGSELAAAVTQGRRKEFAHFKQFASPEARSRIPDPNAADTFQQSKLDWSGLNQAPPADVLQFYKRLLAIRQQKLVPRLVGLEGRKSHFTVLGKRGLRVEWTLGDGSRLYLLANLGEQPIAEVSPPEGEVVFASQEGLLAEPTEQILPPWSVLWRLEESPTASGQ